MNEDLWGGKGMGGGDKGVSVCRRGRPVLGGARCKRVAGQERASEPHIDGVAFSGAGAVGEGVDVVLGGEVELVSPEADILSCHENMAGVTVSIHLSHLFAEGPNVICGNFEVCDVENGCKETVRVEGGVRVESDMRECPDGAAGSFAGTFHACAAGSGRAGGAGSRSPSASNKELSELRWAGRELVPEGREASVSHYDGKRIGGGGLRTAKGL
eukprot:5566932-Amphidinium_carterae.1